MAKPPCWPAFTAMFMRVVPDVASLIAQLPSLADVLVIRRKKRSANTPLPAASAMVVSAVELVIVTFLATLLPRRVGIATALPPTSCSASTTSPSSTAAGSEVFASPPVVTGGLATAAPDAVWPFTIVAWLKSVKTP